MLMKQNTILCVYSIYMKFKHRQNSPLVTEIRVSVVSRGGVRLEGPGKENEDPVWGDGNVNIDLGGGHPGGRDYQTGCILLFINYISVKNKTKQALVKDCMVHGNAVLRRLQSATVKVWLGERQSREGGSGEITGRELGKCVVGLRKGYVGHGR